MRTNTFRSRAGRKAEAGQAMLFTLLGLGIFLIGSMVFAIDLSNMWFHRQVAQTAADAACTAGAMDLLWDQTNNVSAAPYPGHIVPGTNLDCNSTTPNSNGAATTNPSPCVYAALNGYPSTLSQAGATTGTTLGDNVSVIFNGAAAPGVTATTLMEVDVTDNLPTFFAGMLQGKTTQSVRAVAKCGIQQVAAPIPLLVLDPVNPDSSTSAFNIGGTPNVTIFGGPQQSIQVNSTNAAATFINGSALVDLSQGGPATPPTGSNFGVTGGPTTPPACNPGTKGFCAGTTGSWMDPHSPIQDPLQSVVAPTTTVSGVTLTSYPGSGGGSFTPAGSPGGSVPDGSFGCSGNGGGACAVFKPGQYPNGICLGTGGCGGASNAQNAIFQEGLYYMGGDLQLKANSCARMDSRASSTPFNGWGGVIFYFSGTAKLDVDSNSGNSTSGCDSAQTFNVTTGGPTGYGVSCDSNSSTHVPTNLPATLTGNVFLAPCTGPFGDFNLAQGNPVPANPGTQRGILFFQDRSAQGVTGKAGGGGSYAMAGTFYFHSCSSTAIAGANGLNCTQPTGTYSTGGYYHDTLQMDGNPGASSYILGEIIVDNLSLQGTPAIYMDLSPSAALNVYKAALYQ